MQVLNKQNTVFTNIREIKQNYEHHAPIKEMPSDNFDTKEMKSSATMHPVASGDNMAAMLSQNTIGSCRKFEDIIPTLIPCCEGIELPIKPELVRSGLSAISVRLASAEERLSGNPRTAALADPNANPPGSIEHRNSFRCLQRPDLRRVPHLRWLSPADIDALLTDYAECLSNNNGPSETDTADSEYYFGNQDLPGGMQLHSERTNLYTFAEPKRQRII